MRTIINISLPKQMARIVEDTVSSGRFASKSEFFRSLLRMWMENKLVEEIKESKQEMKMGKGKLLKSLKNLR